MPLKNTVHLIAYPNRIGTGLADLANFVKTRLAAHEYPRDVDFVAELPLTTTGKILRRELRDSK